MIKLLKVATPLVDVRTAVVPARVEGPEAKVAVTV